MGHRPGRQYVCLLSVSHTTGVDGSRFASAILLRPSQVRKDKYKRHDTKVVEEKTQYEQQVELKKRLKTMLENEQLIPRVRFPPPSMGSADGQIGTHLPLPVSADDASQQSDARVSVIACQLDCRGACADFEEDIAD